MHNQDLQLVLAAKFMSLLRRIFFYLLTNFFALIVLLFSLVDGKDVGKIQSKLLCKSVLDLYFGDDPFDNQAKEDIRSGLASILFEWFHYWLQINLLNK